MDRETISMAPNTVVTEAGVEHGGKEVSDGAVPLRVVIVSHGRCELLKRTLASIAAAELPEPYRGTLVIETGERFGAERVVQEFDGSIAAQYWFSESPKKTVALNSALAECPDEFLVFLDDDVRIAPETLSAYAEAAATWGRGSYFGGPTGVDYESAPPDWLLKFLPASARGVTFPDNTSVIEFPDYFLGFNWAAFAGDLACCGGFPIHCGPGSPIAGGDETFMQLAMNRSGISGRVVPSAMVWHYVPQDRCSPEWTFARVRDGSFNNGVFAENHASRERQRLAMVRAFAAQAARCLRLRDWVKAAIGYPGGTFAVRCRFASLAAFVRGYRYGIRHRPLSGHSSPQSYPVASEAARGHLVVRRNRSLDPQVEQW